MVSKKVKKIFSLLWKNGHGRAIFDWDWDRNSALEVWHKIPCSVKCFTADCLLHKNMCKFIPYGVAVQLPPYYNLQVEMLRTYHRNMFYCRLFIAQK